MSPLRLQKPENNNGSIFSPLINRIEAWCLRHAVLCLIVSMAFLIALFVCLIFVVTGVSATESGTYYNHFQGVI